MGSFGRLAALALAAAPFLGTSVAQAPWTDPDSGITFSTWPVAGQGTNPGMTVGYALPSNALTVDATEFIGYLQCGTKEAAKGWCGLSFAGGMTNALLLMAWPQGNDVLTSFRFATSYTMPPVYAGNAQVTQVSSTINATHFSLIYRCQNCLKWDNNGATGGASTSTGVIVVGWAQAYSTPENPTCPAQINLNTQHEGQGIFGAQLNSNAANPSYSAWTAKATKTVTGVCSGPTTSSIAGVPVPTATSYDYVIVGAGAGGIPIADKLSEAGKSVLLIEKGPPSTGRWGGKLGPDWLAGTNLTRFDVPGLCNQIWVDSAGIACTDTDQMAGCVLGGGTAVNAGLWWKPYTLDWDYNFPTGWKASDMAAATNRVFGRIPGSDTPSQDGKRYLQQGFEALASGFKKAGWTSVTANNAPNAKNRTYAHSPFMFAKGERNGPLNTYLVTASGRKNFKLWMNTAVKRVVRDGGHATGIEVEPFRNGGYQGTVQLTPVTGRVIVAAGAFGSPKILLRSGIGPADQLAVVKSSRDGPTMVSNSSWINLPVGSNLVDHLNTDTVVEHPAVEFYDFYEAWKAPNETDKNKYLTQRAGIIAQAAPNIGPIFWDEIKGADGIVRQMQWTARVEGSLGTPNGKTMTLSQYLGRGQTSRGRMTITADLNTIVSTVPYLRDPNDKAAVIQGIKNVQAALASASNLTWLFPPPGTTPEKYVDDMVVSTANRRANHWMGTNKLGSDDGRDGRGSAVVDTNTRVFGTDNIFVVDASIFPGMVTPNPTAYIVIAAERASERILALPPNKAQPKWQQCGGLTYNGPFLCEQGTKCVVQNAYYSQCL